MASSVSSKKQKSALIWNAVERFSTQAIHLILSIIIARLLNPSDYGFVGCYGVNFYGNSANSDR